MIVGHGVDDHVELASHSAHLFWIARYHDMVGAQSKCIVGFSLGPGEQTDICTQCLCELQCHMTEPAKANDSDLAADTDIPVQQR